MKSIIFVTSILAVFSTPVFAEWSSQAIAIANRDRPKVLARLGGELDNPALAAYVDSVGQDLVQYSDNPDDDWHFTILDSASVNAFALPAGHVFITRGMLALAKSEAELAAILAHEIHHVTEEHVEKREDAQKDALVDGALGALVQGVLGGDMGAAIRDNVENTFAEMGRFSQDQEFAADRAGIFLLAEAGYDPHGQADFLLMMAANLDLRAAMASREFDASVGSDFANHPALMDRESIARDLAGDLTGFRNQEAFLEAIDGLRFGETKVNVVQNQIFTDPESGLSFNIARGWQARPAENQLNVVGPGGATLVITFAPDRGEILTDYINTWVGRLPNRNRIGRQISDLGNLNSLSMPAAIGTVRYRVRARPGRLQLAVLRFDDRLVRLAGFARDRDNDARRAIENMINSVVQVATTTPSDQPRYQIAIHRVTGNDSVASLAALVPELDHAAAIIRVINGFGDAEHLPRGALIKTIVEAPQ